MACRQSGNWRCGTKGGKWVTLGRDLIPEFGVTTGVRRTGHGLPESNRWDVFWDAPLNHPEEVRRSAASYKADRMAVRTDGARLEVSFPGLSMGVFSGGLRFTVYRGTNLLRLEAVAKTDEPSVAYIYQGGLKGFSPETLPRILWHDEARRAADGAGLRRRAGSSERPAGTEPAGGRTRGRSVPSPSSRRHTSSSSPVNWR